MSALYLTKTIGKISIVVAH